MTDRPRRPPVAALAVTLISGSDPGQNETVARMLAGDATAAVPSSFDASGDDSAEFAVALADALVAEVEAGRRGNTIVLLEPEADVAEIALVLEHVLERRHPPAPVVIRDVMTVTSVREVLSVLCAVEVTARMEAEGDFGGPGRLAARLEFSSVIVLTDLPGLRAPAPSAQVALARAVLSRLAPSSRVVAPAELAGSHQRECVLVRGRAHRLGASMGWQLELGEGARPTWETRPVGAFVFRDPRPFHPERLHEAVCDRLGWECVGRIVRSRGFVQLASRVGRIGSWSSAGAVLDLDPTDLPVWDRESPIGQEIAFFGIDLDPVALRAVLGDCLLDGSELLAGPMVWAGYRDPFPDWASDHRH